MKYIRIEYGTKKRATSAGIKLSIRPAEKKEIPPRYFFRGEVSASAAECVRRRCDAYGFSIKLSSIDEKDGTERDERAYVKIYIPIKYAEERAANAGIKLSITPAIKILNKK